MESIKTKSNILDMAYKIERTSPKIEIIDHFDSLINRVDIDIDKCLDKYSQEQVLINLNCFDVRKRNIRGQMTIYLNRETLILDCKERFKISSLLIIELQNRYISSIFPILSNMSKSTKKL